MINVRNNISYAYSKARNPHMTWITGNVKMKILRSIIRNIYKKLETSITNSYRNRTIIKL